MGLEPEIRVDVGTDIPDESLERGSWQEESSRFLVSFDLSERHGTWSESVLFGFFDASNGRSGLLVGLGRSFGLDFGWWLDGFALGRDLLGLDLCGSVLLLWHGDKIELGLKI